MLTVEYTEYPLICVQLCKIFKKGQSYSSQGGFILVARRFQAVATGNDSCTNLALLQCSDIGSAVSFSIHISTGYSRTLMGGHGVQLIFNKQVSELSTPTCHGLGLSGTQSCVDI
jgi:hypothetical protein